MCCAVLCCAVPCRAVPCRAVPCRAVPCCAAPCCATCCNALRHGNPCHPELPFVQHQHCIIGEMSSAAISLRQHFHATISCHLCLQMASELQHMQAALDRATNDEYHKLDPSGHGQELKGLQDSRAQRKQDFSNQFLSLLHQHEMARHSSFADVRFECLSCNFS